MTVTMIGAASIDIAVKSKHQTLIETSNPADITLSAGGVARNIAVMLAMHDVEVNLIAAIGSDPLGRILLDNCNEFGLNTKSVVTRKNTGTSITVNTMRSNNDILARFNAVTSSESIKPSDIDKCSELISDADLLFMDLTISETAMASAISHRGDRPIMVDATKVEYVKKAENFLKDITILRLNRSQAEVLSGISLESKERVKQASYSIVSRGVANVFVTLAVAGACAADSKGAIFVPAMPVATKDTYGAGQAFSAGVALEFDKDIRTMVERGISLAGKHLGRKK